MAQSITIVGGLAIDCDRRELLQLLRVETGDEIEWDWLKAEASQFNLPQNPLRRLLAKLRDSHDKPTVVLLHNLHGRDTAKIYGALPEPVRPPHDLHTGDQLVEWLCSREAGLVPVREWYASVQESALVAILCKLLKNRSWSKDSQGHQWTRESDLLGQAPVNRRDYPGILDAAKRLLPRLRGVLLLRKGSEGGRTPKEWCINHNVLSSVKQAILHQSVHVLPGIDSIIAAMARDEDKRYRLDGEVVKETIRVVCREKHGVDAAKAIPGDRRGR